MFNLKYKKIIFMAVVIPLGLISLLTSCSSSKKERVPEDIVHQDIQRDYLVVDASSPVRPGWIEDAEIWSREHRGDNDSYRYFSFETSPMSSRSIACSLARANATADIAREISTRIDSRLMQSTYGDPSINENSPHVRPLREYVEHTLSEEVQAEVSGARVLKTYWEKRRFQKDMGAVRDYIGWTCASYIQMDASHLDRLINIAIEKVYDRARAESEQASAFAREALSKMHNN